MITKWWYEGRDNSNGRLEVKSTILNNNYKAIDIGAGVLYWSYPECKYVGDIMSLSQFKVQGDDITLFNINLQDSNTWGELIDYVSKNGKFDYSICSHTLEDIINPIEVIKLLEIISKKGFIAIPSKYEELTFLHGSYYRGNPHHKYIFTVINNRIQILPKLSFIEKNERSDKLSEEYKKGIQLSIYWEDTIEYDLFGFIPIHSPDGLINTYYQILEHETNP